MLKATAGQILINSALPENIRNYSRVLDKGGVTDLFREVYAKHPDKYKDVAQKLMDLGHYNALAGGSSLTLEDMLVPEHVNKDIEALRAKIHAIAQSDLDQPTKAKQITELVLAVNPSIEKGIYDHGVANNNNLALQVKSGSRGNATQMKQIVAGDMLVEDQHGDIVPIPITHGYAHGLTPAEYWAGSYGARKGTLCLAENTPVLMADYTVKPIKAVRIGDSVMGADLTGGFKPVKVTQVFDNGINPVWQYTFRKNSAHEFVTLDATETHKILAQVREGRPGAIYAYRSVYKNTVLPLNRALIRKVPVKNTFVAIPASGEYDTGFAEPKALLLGLMLGDGCMSLTSRTGYTLSCADNMLIKDITDYLASLNLRLQKESKSNYKYGLRYLVRPQNTNRLHPVKRWLRDIVNVAGKKSYEKHIPEVVFQWSSSSVRALVAGLFSTDGSITLRPAGISISFTSTSLALVETLKRLLELKLGIWCGAISQSIRTEHPWSSRPIYCLTIAHAQAVKQFYNQIPLVGIKAACLAAGIPTIRETHQNKEYGFKLQGRRFLGNMQTYDIEVDHPEHLFVLANGLCVHNSVKLSTSDAGYLGKQLAMISHRLVVSSNDCGTLNGMPVDGGDKDNVGTILAADTAKYKAGTVITKGMVKDLNGVPILVRSPTTCQADHGICAKCAGVRESGKLPEIGSNVGMAGANSVGEPLAQGSLNVKHTGGAVQQNKNAKGGFDYINNLVQVPKTFRDGAVIASLDGYVGAVTDAPQGGQYVTIKNKQHYVPPGYEIKVKPGQRVVAGDMLSDGIPNPADMVLYKGIGEGRRQFVQTMCDTLKNSNIKANRRNIELISRGLINHVRIRDFDPSLDHMPDDLVSYDTVSRTYKPRENSQLLDSHKTEGKYLERPVLHYSIGTKITPEVMNNLKTYNIPQVVVHDQPPMFDPEMVRGMETGMRDENWVTRLGGSYLNKSFTTAVQRGQDAQIHSTSYYPSLTLDPHNFGKDLKTRGIY